MLGRDPFYHAIIRKHVAVFGTVFNDIAVVRKGDGGRQDLIKVPLEYAPRDKTVARYLADPDFGRKYSIMLPRMSFEMTGMTYDPSRSINRLANARLPESTLSSYSFAPYNLAFELNIYARHVEDGTQVVEQILPYFRPQWTVTADLLDQVNLLIDIPIILNSVSHTDSYEGDFVSRRAIIWTLNFTVQALFPGPIVDRPIIRTADINFFDSDVEDVLFASIETTPGQTADGQATSNTALTLPPSNVDPTKPYVPITTITE